MPHAQGHGVTTHALSAIQEAHEGPGACQGGACPYMAPTPLGGEVRSAQEVHNQVARTALHSGAGGDPRMGEGGPHSEGGARGRRSGAADGRRSVAADGRGGMAVGRLHSVEVGGRHSVEGDGARGVVHTHMGEAVHSRRRGGGAAGMAHREVVHHMEVCLGAQRGGRMARHLVRLLGAACPGEVPPRTAGPAHSRAAGSRVRPARTRHRACHCCQARG
mmetsp:Transcript_30945/g.68531  ORF Transcript_30945/g.68531 Transcript_30945/m.68531 type:complete len:219 (-) Transcript_30945:2068-2724(-)